MCQMRMGYLVAIGMMVWGLGGNAFGQTIKLKSLMTAELGQDVRLGDVATVSGVEGKKAEELANTVVVAGIEKPLQLKAEAVLMAVMEQRGAAVLGSNLQVSGAAACVIEIPGVASDPKAKTGAKRGSKGDQKEVQSGVKVATNGSELGKIGGGIGGVSDPGTTPQIPSNVVANSTQVAANPSTNVPNLDPKLEPAGDILRTVIVNKVVEGLGAAAEDVRVDLNTTSPLVDMPVGKGQRWLIRPLTRTMLGTVQFEAQLAEGTKILQRLNLATEVQRRQRVLVTTQRIGRGDIVTGEMMKMDDVWVDRNVPTLIAAEKDVTGLEAQRDMDVGAQMDQRDFKPALMTRKGDQLTVIYLSGPLEVQVRGRAMMDAKLHDAVDVRNDSTGEKFSAVMVKKGVGVVGAMTAEQEKRIRETQ